jgi:hypothetical protein
MVRKSTGSGNSRTFPSVAESLRAESLMEIQMNDRTNKVMFGDTNSLASLVPLALFTFGALISGTVGHTSPSDNKPSNAPTLSKTVDDREPLSALKDPPLSRQEKSSGKKPDQASTSGAAPNSGERFPDTPVGRALHKHLLILVDVSAGADEKKERSLEELRKNPKEVSQVLLAAYHHANSADYFGRWLLTLTLSELKTNEAYSGLRELATSKIPSGLKDNDHEGSALANESAIRQNAAEGLAQLARAGNSAAEKDLLGLAVSPPSGDDAVRTVAIKGYLAAGRDYDARVRTMKAQVPKRYYDVVTLTVSPPDQVTVPSNSAAKPKNGG